MYVLSWPKNNNKYYKNVEYKKLSKPWLRYIRQLLACKNSGDSYLHGLLHGAVSVRLVQNVRRPVYPKILILESSQKNS